MTGKKIEITLLKDENSTSSEDEMKTEDSEELLDLLAKMCKMIDKNTKESNLKICLDTVPEPDEFFKKLNQMIDSANLADVKVILNMKLIK